MKAAIYTLQSKYFKYQMLFAAFAMFVQRSPVVRIAVAMERVVKAPFARLAQLAAVVFTASSIPQSVTGATTFSSSPASPTTAKTGESFDLVFAVTGAPSTVASWKITGTLPQGLSIPGLSGQTLNSRVGTITGTPTETGTFQITAQPYSKTNLKGDTNKKAYPISITVSQGTVTVPTTTFSATPNATTSGTIGQTFSQSFSITGITAASWQVLGSLPPGLTVSGPSGQSLSGTTLNAVSGTISGTPTTAGSYNLTVQAYDGANLTGVTDAQLYPLKITVAERTFQSPFEEWNFTHFGTTSAPENDDLDHDGFNNLLEYALGLDPSHSDSPQNLRQTITQQHGQLVIVTQFKRALNRPDIDIIVETTPSPRQTWSPIATSAQGAPFAGSAIIQETPASTSSIQVSIQTSVATASSAQCFQRIRVVRK